MFALLFDYLRGCKENEQDIQAVDYHIFKMHDLGPAGKQEPVKIKRACNQGPKIVMPMATKKYFKKIKMLLVQKGLYPGLIIYTIELAEYGRIVDAENGENEEKNEKRGAYNRV